LLPTPDVSTTASFASAARASDPPELSSISVPPTTSSATHEIAKRYLVFYRALKEYKLAPVRTSPPLRARFERIFKRQHRLLTLTGCSYAVSQQEAPARSRTPEIRSTPTLRKHIRAFSPKEKFPRTVSEKARRPHIMLASPNR